MLLNPNVLTNAPHTCHLSGMHYADHDILFTECTLSLKRNKKAHRNIQQFHKAKKKEEKIKTNYDNSTTNELWLTLKEDLIKTITANISQNKTKNTK